MKPTELENRLIDFSVMTIGIAEELRKTFKGRYLSHQLIRSGTSAALNYGEAQGGESRKDFIHKMKIVLKELRETFVCIRIIQAANFKNLTSNLDSALDEANQLISIFVASVNTAQKTKGLEIRD